MTTPETEKIRKAQEQAWDDPLTHLAHSQMTPHWRVNGLISTAGQMLRMDAGEPE